MTSPQRPTMIDPTKSPTARYRLDDRRHEPSAATGIELIGGPRGRYARGAAKGLPTSAVALIGVAVIFLIFGYLSKSHCGAGAPDGHGGFGLNWSGHRQFVWACYNDIMPLYGAEGFKDGAFPYQYHWLDHGQPRYTEYPVLTGLFMWVCATITRHLYPVIAAMPGNTLPETTVYFATNAIILAILWVITVWLVARLAGNRTLDAIVVAASPLIIIHAFTNWDIIPCLFVVGAFAAARKNALVAGVLLGIGTAFKLWPLFILGAYLVIALRTKTIRQWLIMAASTIATVAAVNLPIALLWPQGWSEFFRMNTHRGWEWTTVWALFSRTTGWTGFDHGNDIPSTLNTVTLVAFLALCAAILVLGLKAPTTPRVAQLSFLIVAAFLLTNKVYSPQYSLWLVPLAALALPSWRLLWAWMSIDALLWPVLMWHMLGVDKKGLPHEFLDLMVVGRDGMIITISVLIVMTILGRRVDRVRASHDGNDPLAGVFSPVVPVAVDDNFSQADSATVTGGDGDA